MPVETVPARRAVLRREARRIPGTLVYAALVVATTLVAWAMPDAALDRLLRHVSTNLANLGTRPVYALLASALWDGRAAWWFLVAFAVVHGITERQLGTRRWLVVILAAHVVGTLVSQGLVAWGVARGALPASLVRTDDYGVSYTMAGAVGALVWAVPRHWRAWSAAAVLGYATWPLVDGATFTDIGHLVALLTGLCLAAPVAAPASTTPTRQPATGSGIGPTVPLGAAG